MVGQKRLFLRLFSGNLPAMFSLFALSIHRLRFSSSLVIEKNGAIFQICPTFLFQFCSYALMQMNGCKNDSILFFSDFFWGRIGIQVLVFMLFGNTILSFYETMFFVATICSRFYFLTQFCGQFKFFSITLK